jgi:hypothetical protein
VAGHLGDGQPVQRGHRRREHEGQDALAGHGQVGGRVAGVRDQFGTPLGLPGPGVGHGGEEQPLLVAEVPVDRLLADSRGGRDGIDAGPGVALGAEQCHGGVQDGLPLGRRAPRSPVLPGFLLVQRLVGRHRVSVSASKLNRLV